MKTMIITVIALYSLYVALYLLYERFHARRRKKRCRQDPGGLADAIPVEDLIGKSTFDVCHSLPEASRDENREKPFENGDIFAASNRMPPTARLPEEVLDEAFSHGEEENEPMDIEIALEYITEDGQYGQEEEEEESWLQGNVNLAECTTFEELGLSVHTVVHHGSATLPEKERAGGVLLDIRQTDLFEQVVQSAPGREDVVGELMRLHLEAYHRRMEEATGESGNKGRQAPGDFDIRNFV